MISCRIWRSSWYWGHCRFSDDSIRLSEGKQTLSVNPVESSPLTVCLCVPNSNLVVLGTLQNEIALYQLDCCRLESVAHVHDDSITALGSNSIWSQVENRLFWNEKLFFTNRTGIGRDGNQLILASGSSDCSVKLWRLRQVGKDSAHPDYRFRSPSDLLNELEHNSAVLCLDFDKYANPLF